MALNSICVTSSAPPANNLCTNATALPCGTTNLAGTTVNTANIAHGTGCSMSNYGVWYTFVGDGNPTTITTNPAFDIKLSIATGTCGTLSNVVCNDTSPETSTFTTVSGVTYYVYVAYWSAGGTTTGTFTISRSCVTCAPPTATAATNLTFTTATVNWSPPSYIPSNGYQYVVSTSATPPGSGTATALNSINVTGLIANTVYYLHVRSNCGATNGFSIWSTISFTTGYCASTSTSSTYYIKDFSTTGGTANITNNGSGYSATGYGNFTAKVVSQQQYGSVSFSTTLIGGTSGFNIWVDWNDDFDFDDANELVYTAGTYVSSATGSFTVPGTAAVGNHRMRIVDNYISSNPIACGAITSGETEDYTFTVLASACPGIPTSVVATVTSTTTATINWTASSPAPASGYQIFVTTLTTLPTGATVPTQTTAAGVTTLALTGLTPNTTYYVYVRNNCGSGNVSPWTAQVSFFTGYCVYSTSTSTYWISNFTTTLGTININRTSTYSAGGYANYSATDKVNQISGGAFNFSVTMNSSSHGINIYVDWNNDLDFNDSGELVYASGAYVTSATGSISIPIGAALGDHRMRVVSNYFNSNPLACGSDSYTEAEDYTVTVLAPPACSGTPTAGTVVANPNTAWAGAPYTVTATGPTNASNMTYQWQYSTTGTGGPWINAGVATSTYSDYNATAPVSGVVLWHLVVTCTNSGQSATSSNGTFTTMTVSTVVTGCPNVVAGGLGLGGADPANLTCSTGSCTDLEATYLNLGNTSSYIVEPILYNPPYSFSGLANPVSVNVDDVWSPLVNLPFDFCFYGNTYNKCTIGSNGILSFNTALAGTSSGYSFSNNIPISGNSQLVENSIFGVFHDINPGISGQVGWELITLPTGCRALVASWYNVPMFSDNTIKYTGMMVLYENSNIIEVYIKDKKVDNNDVSPWNGGNAIVGIQNATGTLAAVPPGRNGLDTNWTSTNEAWRFVPNGTSIASLKWYEGSGTSGTMIGTTDIINVCPPVTTTYTAEITYTLCDGRTIKELDETTVTVAANKTWNGSSSSNWNTSANWTPSGAPLASEGVLIPNTTNKPVISGGITAVACSVNIQSGGLLTINAANTLTVTNAVVVATGGNMIVDNTGSLVQINNVSNTGNIQYNRTANIRKLDYVYWSSPVAGFNNSAISPGTPLGFQYKWTPTIGTNTNGFGNWAYANETMVIGKGYIVRGSNALTGTAAPYTATFIGVPNNGNISIPISRGTWNGANYSTGVSTTPGTKDDDNWNLAGNPYPSAIKAIDFLALNTNIDGFVNVWTHGTLPSTAIADPFYNDYAYNYTPADYITYNSVGASTGAGTFNGFIAGGQGFFVSMLHASATPSTLIFNNTLRNKAHNNSVFYKTSNENKITDELEKHRIWFDLVTPSGTSVRSLLGYVENATNEKDRLFDAFSNEKLSFNIFSLIEDEQMLIQGRKLPFDVNDKVNIGVAIPQDGLYKIAIGSVDGLFSDTNQKIYLEDKVLNVIYDLKSAPYSFIENKGIIKNRFILRYTKSDNITELTNQVTVYDNNILTVQSGKLKIKDIVIFDTLGKLILNKNNVNNKDYQITNLNRTNSLLIIKVTLEDNSEEVRKIIY